MAPRPHTHTNDTTRVCPRQRLSSHNGRTPLTPHRRTTEKGGPRRLNPLCSVRHCMHLPCRTGGRPVHPNRPTIDQDVHRCNRTQDPRVRGCKAEPPSARASTDSRNCPWPRRPIPTQQGKVSKAGYVSICNDAEVNIYDGRTVKITVSEEDVLKGWRCPRTRMWQIPLKHTVRNEQTDTLILNSPS